MKLENELPEPLETFTQKTQVITESGVMDFDTKRVELYTTAKKKKLFLLSAESIRKGFKADWAHFDFMLTRRMPPGLNHYEYLMIFWSELWTYLSPMLNAYERLSARYMVSVVDNKESLAEYSNAITENKIIGEWAQNNLSAQKKKHLYWYITKRKEELENERKKIVEDFTVRQAARELKAEGQAEQKAGFHPGPGMSNPEVPDNEPKTGNPQ